MVQDEAALSPTEAAQVPPCAEVIKLVPITDMELDWYPASGVSADAVGAATTVSVVPGTEAANPELLNVTSTEDAPNGVPVAITTRSAVALT